MMTVGARNSLDSVPISPYLGICTARTVVTDVPVLLLNRPNAWSLSLTELLHGFKTGVICVIEKNTLILISPYHFITILHFLNVCLLFKQVEELENDDISLISLSIRAMVEYPILPMLSTLQAASLKGKSGK